MIPRWELLPFLRGDGIVVNGKDPAPFRHCIRMPLDKLSIVAEQSLDFVVVRDRLDPIAMRQCWTKLKVGGRLVLAMAVLASINVPAALDAFGWDWIHHSEHGDDAIQVFRRRSDADHREDFPSLPAMSAGIFRTGPGYGDALWASSVAGVLREQGYSVTAYVSDEGEEVLRHDPNIDRFVVMTSKMIATEDLQEFWEYEATKHQKFVNFFGVVESNVLYRDGQIQMHWPHALRHKMSDHNYLELYHDVAGLPHDFRMRFYPTEAELCAFPKHDDEVRVVLVDTGSHLSKWWPYMGDLALEVIATMPKAQVYVLGNPRTRMPKHERIHEIGRAHSFRRAAALVLSADIVVGQDTGLLTVAAFEAMPKIVLLGHSSPENVTKHWLNTLPLVPNEKAAPCHPCHMIHSSWDTCLRDKATGAPACQADIRRETVMSAILEALP